MMIPKRKNMDQQIWLITGISSGLGKALAEAVIERGDFVVGTFRQQQQVDSFNETHDGKAWGLRMELTRDDDLQNTVNSVVDQFGRIDVLVNNAGVGFAGAVEEATADEVRQVMEVNFFGPLRLTQLVLPHMRNRKAGTIIQISSHAGVKAFAGFGVYNASKFALEGFSEAMAQEVAPLGIRVHLVEPGPFRTQFAAAGLGLAENQIPDYDETAGAFRKKLKSVSGSQEGNPQLAARAIIEFVQNKDATLRLPLGKTALFTMGLKVKSLQEDLARNEATAAASVFTEE